MKITSFLLFSIFLFAVPAFGQMGIITTDAKLRALEKEGKYDEAIADINERIKNQPDNGELYLRRAEFLKLQNKLDEAIADISEGIKVNPDNPTFYIARAEYYNLAKNINAVLRDVQIAASLAPNKGGILNVGTRELARAEQYKESIKLADFYLAQNAFDDVASSRIKFLAYKIRGENKFALKDYSGALEDSITAIDFIQLKGDWNEYHNAQSSLIQMTKSDVVIQTTQNYLRNDKRIFGYYERLFDALQSKTEMSTEREVSEHIEFLKRIKADKPTGLSMVGASSSRYLYQLMFYCAALYIEKNQVEQAEKLLKRVVELKLPAKWMRYAERANFYVELKNYRAAIDDLTFVISDDEDMRAYRPGSIQFLYQRAGLYEIVNEFDKAVADYEAIKTIDPRNETAANAMILKARQKQTENANQPK